MDPLSDVLSLLKPRSYMSGGFGSRGDISVRFPRHDGIKCYAVVSGECWLVLEGAGDPVRLKTGDCFLLPRGWPFCLTTDLALTPVDYTRFPFPANGGAAPFDGDGEGGCFLVGGHFALAGGPAGALLSVLPPIVHIREDADKATLRWAVERMMQELREPQPGGFLVAQHLAQLLLVQALRAHLAEGSGGVGWLFALADRRMSAAITAMHENPAHRWTLQALAARAGMSRSSFALRFRETVGEPPMEYLTRWRMLLAGDRLANAGEPVSTIALTLGYESESAFSAAFKRVMGCSPRQYGRDRSPAPVRAASAVAPADLAQLVAG